MVDRAKFLAWKWFLVSVLLVPALIMSGRCNPSYVGIGRVLWWWSRVASGVVWGSLSPSFPVGFWGCFYVFCLWWLTVWPFVVRPLFFSCLF